MPEREGEIIDCERGKLVEWKSPTGGQIEDHDLRRIRRGHRQWKGQTWTIDVRPIRKKQQSRQVGRRGSAVDQQNSIGMGRRRQQPQDDENQEPHRAGSAAAGSRDLDFLVLLEIPARRHSPSGISVDSRNGVDPLNPAILEGHEVGRKCSSGVRRAVFLHP